LLISSLCCLDRAQTHITFSTALLTQRQSKLLKRGITLQPLTPDLQAYVLADFLKLQNPGKKLLAVGHSFNVLLKACEVFTFVPRACHLKWLESVLGMSAFDSAMVKKVVGKEIKRRVMMRKVFSTVWPRISKFSGPLSANVRAVLSVPNLPQTDSAATVPLPTTKPAAEISVLDSVKTRISLEFPHVNLDIFKTEKYTELSTRLKFYPNHPSHQFDQIYKLVVDDLIVPKDLPIRKDLLINTMKTYNPPLIYRSDSRFANQFVHGETLASVDEVVAILALTRDLFAYSHVAWYNLRFKYEKELEDLVLRDGMDWKEAYEKIVKTREFLENCNEFVRGKKRKAVEIIDALDEWKEW
jgi:hypothetical protein